MIEPLVATYLLRPPRSGRSLKAGTFDTMRSKYMPARALFRLVTTASTPSQASSSAAAAASASAAAGSSAAATSSASTSQQQQQQSRRQTQHASSPSRSFRRRQQPLTNGSGSFTRGRRSAMASRLRSDSEAAQTMDRIKEMMHSSPQPTQLVRPLHMMYESASFHNALTVPPLMSLGDVATQAFFAHHRPLLEYLVVRGEADLSSIYPEQIMAMGRDAHQEESEAIRTAAEQDEIAQVKNLLMSAHGAISEVVSQAQNMSQEELSRTTFIIHEEGEPTAEDLARGGIQGQLKRLAEESKAKKAQWAKQLEKLDAARFNKIIDRLAEPEAPAKDVIKAEVDAIAAEEERKREIQGAVDDALEYGENPEAARVLGREADLVILGEPKGAEPTWARGVATHLAQNTRAFEPPAAPAPQEDATSHMGSDKSTNANKTMSRRYNGVFLNLTEDDPNLLLGHAMVQARLSSSLEWDRVVAQMDAATLEDGASASATPHVDVSKLNADLPPARNVSDDLGENIIQINLDSVKRKRRKKMRKHKYKKLRKLTRTERSRLKKQ